MIIIESGNDLKMKNVTEGSKLDKGYAGRASTIQVTRSLDINVKSDFLYGNIKEEVYVCQPPGFKDPDFPNRVYKVEKALYGLHQAPRAWYETLSTYLLDNGFQRGKIDKTVGIKRLLNDLRVTAAKVCGTAAKLNTSSVKLVLLVKIEENILSSYYCLYTVNAVGVKVTTIVLKVNAASTKVTTAQRLRLLKGFLLSEKG
ncbi:putative ribonuclease H-like domain-containing protein [Tanacetum coccineum]